MGSAGGSRPVIEAHAVAKAFGATQALAGVDLVVHPGQVFALLGPNGAGKTTLVRILTTLTGKDAGQATVVGLDVASSPAEVRSVVGLTGQFTAIDPLLTGRENLELVAELFHLPRSERRRRASDLLTEFDLAAVADRLVRTYSGGMQRRLDLAASLVARPPVLILDEPTTGLDPRSRAQMWAAVGGLVDAGTTVLLTTQYLEEADRLADRIALIDRGRIVAEGTADELKMKTGADVLDVRIEATGDLSSAVSALSCLGEPHTLDADRGTITLPAPSGVATLRMALDRLDSAGIPVGDIGIRRPSLDEAFLALTDGRAGPMAAGSTSSIATMPAARRVQASRPARQRHSTVLRDTWAVTKRNLLRITRTPRLLLVSSVQPILYVLMFRYVFGSSLAARNMSYVDYLLPGILVTASLFGATTAVAMASDLSAGMVDRFRSLPMARSAVLAGRCVADLLRSLIVVALVFAAGVAIGFRPHGSLPALLAAILVVLATAFSFIWLYALIGMVVKDPETAQLSGFLVVVPFIFVSSVFVRVEKMPGWLQVFARHQPVTLAVDTVRALCQGGPVGAVAWQSSLWIAGILAVCGWAAVRAYQRA